MAGWWLIHRPVKTVKTRGKEEWPSLSGLLLLRFNLIVLGGLFLWAAALLWLASNSYIGDTGIRLLPLFYTPTHLFIPVALTAAGGLALWALAFLLPAPVNGGWTLLLLVPGVFMFIYQAGWLPSEFAKMFDMRRADFASRFGAGSFMAGELVLGFSLAALIVGWHQSRRWLEQQFERQAGDGAVIANGLGRKNIFRGAIGWSVSLALLIILILVDRLIPLGAIPTDFRIYNHVIWFAVGLPVIAAIYASGNDWMGPRRRHDVSYTQQHTRL